MKELVVDAVVENIEQVTEFVDAFLEENECSMKVQIQMNVAIDEIMSNVAFYAYGDKVGKITVQIENHENPRSISLVFIDSGTQYNPLEADEPDITLSVDEREIGGLGIFMVKKTMDDLKYEYVDGKNKLTLIKNY